MEILAGETTMLLSVIFCTFLNEHEQNGFVFSMAQDETDKTDNDGSDFIFP